MRKIAYATLAVVIVFSGLVLCVRATTNMLREDHLANYHGSDSSNLVLKGVITDISLNYEEQIPGYVYHVSQARVALNVTEFVWGGGMCENQTTSADYWLKQGIVQVYYDKSDVSKLAVGQTVEFKGCYCPWFEDSLYSEMLVVDPKITDSYINPL